MNDAAGFASEPDAADALLAPFSDTLFWPPAAMVAGASGYGHVPFYHWLTAAAAPGRAVSLAADRTMALPSFCEAVQRLALPTDCIGWSESAAPAGPIAGALRALVQARYAGISQTRCGEMVSSIGLLHVEAEQLSPARWATLRPHLSPGALLLISFGGADPERHAVWSDLAAVHPGLTLPLDGGLGLICLGSVPAQLLALCDPRSATAARVRTRFAVLGERWRIETAAPAAAAPAEQRDATARAVAAELLVRSQAADIERLRAEATGLRTEWERVTQATTWRLAETLRAATMLLRGRPPSAVPKIEARLLSNAAAAAAVAPVRGSVLFLSGEPETPGTVYRCTRMVAAAEAAGWRARWLPYNGVDGNDIADCDIMIMWRVTASEHMRTVMKLARHHKVRLALDLDDLMIRPELAQGRFIDALRLDRSEARVAAMFEGMIGIMDNVDFCTATTEELAGDMRTSQRAVYVLPNGFDEATLARSRLAKRRFVPDGVLRIGYASGSRTHQKDFAEAVEAIADVLRARPEVRLVLFKSSDDRGVLLADEFPALADLGERIEWRYMVPLEQLPDELARFDVNLVPLQEANPFVDAKSELKYFEAALAGTPTVASPTGPYARAIEDGVTGLLASGREGWRAAILRLLDDPELRARMARDALHDVLFRFGPQARAQHLGRILAQQRPDRPAEAAAAYALDVALQQGTLQQGGRRLPVVTATETLFAKDALGEAAVTVVIASFNYADYIQQALDSVRLQTLPVLDLVVVDDCSTDPATVGQILDWAQLHAARFNRLVVLQHRKNVGLGGTRNAGFAAAETPYVLLLDADNRLRPDTAERLLEAVSGTHAAFAYPTLQGFGASDRVWGRQMWEPQRLVGGNYIDAMALVAKWAWAAAGGYYVARDAMGWEDFSLWCRLAELGQYGVSVPEAVAEYRLHAQSMVNAITETANTKQALVQLVERQHPWLRIIARDARARQ